MDKQKDYHCVISLLLLFFLFTDSGFASDSSVNDEVVEHHRRPQYRPLSKLFAFGDNLDTGNNKFTARSWKFPYGITFPGFPTGRYSDGLVMTDFLASFMGIQSPIPYKKWNKLSRISVRNGMNFAHAGTGVFNTRNKEPNMTTQINTFKKYISYGVFNRRDLDKSIAVVALSGNDYGQYKLDGGTDKGFRAYSEKVLAQLEVNLREIGKTGIRKIAMLTLEPMGCLPRTAVSISYGKCNELFNYESVLHNTLLKQILQRLNSETTDCPYHVLDLYSAFLYVANNQAGQDNKGVTKTGRMQFRYPLLKPCCVSTSAEYLCGSVDDNGVPQYTLCDNPSDNLFWDSVHLSQSGWRAISLALRPSFEEIIGDYQLNIKTQRPSLSASL